MDLATLLTPEMKERVDAMPDAERNTFWWTEFDEYMNTLPIADLMMITERVPYKRVAAISSIVKKMEDAGLKRTGVWEYAVPCCGNIYGWRQTATALEHIKHSPCPAGFTIVDGMCVCDCKRKCETPELAKAHQSKVGNCLHERRRRQKLFCVVCEHQSETTKQYEEHIATKTHEKKANPINLTCDACKITCRSPKEFERHCKGKHHLFKINPALRPSYVCECCKITCLSAKQLEAHNETNKHKKNAPPS